MAELTEIVTATDVTNALSTQAYARLFAKNGGATADTAFRDRCVAQANSRIRTLTRAAFPDGLYLTTDTVDPEVTGRGVDIVCMIAASRHASAGATAGDESGAYLSHGRAAERFFREMSRDADARPPNSNASVGDARPRAANTNLTDSANEYTNPYTRAADRRDGSAF